MSKLIIFCSPNDVYREMTQQTAAKQYTDMSIINFEKAIPIDEKFRPVKNIQDTEAIIKQSDYQSVIAQKQGQNIILTLFANLPIIGFEQNEEPIYVSSYLFGPEMEDKKLLGPDLDVILLEGDQRIQKAAQLFTDFYQKYGWLTYIHSEDIKGTVNVPSNSKKFNGLLINPESLRQIAKEKLGYSLTDLCYKQ